MMRRTSWDKKYWIKTLIILLLNTFVTLFEIIIKAWLKCFNNNSTRVKTRMKMMTKNSKMMTKRNQKKSKKSPSQGHLHNLFYRNRHPGALKLLKFSPNNIAAQRNSWSLNHCKCWKNKSTRKMHINGIITAKIQTALIKTGPINIESYINFFINFVFSIFFIQ